MSTPIHFNAGETIFKTGEAGTAMYIVKSGEVELYLGEHLVETVGTEGVFGEMALVDKSPRSATAIAKSDCELRLIEEKQFLFMVQETPLFALKVLRTLTHRLRSMNQLTPV